MLVHFLKTAALLYLMLTLVATLPVHAQTSPTLEQTIMEQDRQLFEIGFNECNFEVFDNIFGKEFEFYDDRSGFNDSREKEIRAFKERCENASDLKRELISSRVSPLGERYALQVGEHAFSIQGEVIETASFIHIWRLIGSNWVVHRVVSYDHAPVEAMAEDS